MLFCKMRVQRYCFFLERPNFFLTFASKLTNYSRITMKIYVLIAIIVGILLLVLSFFASFADNNSTRLVGLVLIVFGAVAHVYELKRESRY